MHVRRQTNWRCVLGWRRRAHILITLMIRRCSPLVAIKSWGKKKMFFFCSGRSICTRLVGEIREKEEQKEKDNNLGNNLTEHNWNFSEPEFYETKTPRCHSLRVFSHQKMCFLFLWILFAVLMHPPHRNSCCAGARGVERVTALN